jgi:putative endonuclease
MYTGITTDVTRRFEEHKAGKGGNYTRTHKPVKVLYTEKQPDRGSALKREAEIKKLPRKRKESLVNTVRPK